MRAERKLDSWQKKLVARILDAYERTGTYRGDTERKQSVRIPVNRIFADYESDHVNLEELEAFEQSMRDLERFSPIRIVYRDKKIKNEFRLIFHRNNETKAFS